MADAAPSVFSEVRKRADLQRFMIDLNKIIFSILNNDSTEVNKYQPLRT